MSVVPQLFRKQPSTRPRPRRQTRLFRFPLSPCSFCIRVCSLSLDPLARSCSRSAVEEMDEGSNSTTSFPKPHVRGGGGLFSLGTPAFSSCQSASTSGSAGSPSSRSEIVATTPASENTLVRLNHLDIHGDDEGTPEGAVR